MLFFMAEKYLKFIICFINKTTIPYSLYKNYRLAFTPALVYCVYYINPLTKRVLNHDYQFIFIQVLKFKWTLNIIY